MKTTVKVVPLEDQYDGHVLTFRKGKEYIANILADDNLSAAGENGNEYRIGGNASGIPYWGDYGFRKKFEMLDPPITCIETDIWEPVPDNPHFVRKVRNKTYKEVFDETRKFLEERGIWNTLDYFHLCRANLDKEFEKKEVPDWRFIACYAVTGSSEGHYIHVDLIKTDGSTEVLFLGKTFLGMEHALHVSNMLTRVFWDEYKAAVKPLEK